MDTPSRVVIRDTCISRDMLQPILDAVDYLAAKADRPGFDWVSFLSVLLVANDAFELAVDLCQYRTLENDTIPPKLQGKVDANQLEKTRKYSRAKLSHSMYVRVYKLAVNLLAYHIFFAAWTWNLSERVCAKLGTNNEILTGVVFNNINVFLVALIDLPTELYFQFVLEEKFGFNKSNLSLFVSDFAKKQAVGVCFNSVLIAALGWIVGYFGNKFFVYAALLVVGFVLLFSVLSPMVIDPLFNKYEPLPDGELKQQIDKLAASLDFPLKHIYVQDSSKRSSHSNAYFIGLPWYKQIVLFDTLVEQCTTEQIIAILGHELGHWKLNHISKHLAINSLIIFVLFGMFACFINNQSLYAALGLAEPHWIVGFLVFSDIMAPIQAPLKFFLTHTIRSHEYDADEFSSNLGLGRDLSSGLVVIAKENLSCLHAHPVYAAYHHSHPILPERLNALDGYIAAYEKKTK